MRAGFTSIEHGIDLDDEAIDRMLAHSTILVPTLVAPTAVLEAADAGEPVPPWTEAKATMVVEAHRERGPAPTALVSRSPWGTDSGVGRLAPTCANWRSCWRCPSPRWRRAARAP